MSHFDQIYNMQAATATHLIHEKKHHTCDTYMRVSGLYLHPLRVSSARKSLSYKTSIRVVMGRF